MLEALSNIWNYAKRLLSKEVSLLSLSIDLSDLTSDAFSDN